MTRDDRMPHGHRSKEATGAVRITSARRSVEAARPSDVIFPKRRSLRAEEVVVHPRLEDVLEALWRRWGPRLARVFRLVVALWPLLVAAGGGWLTVRVGRSWLAERERQSRNEALQIRAERVVGELLDEIGHGVEVWAVKVGEMPGFAAVYYEPRERAIVFSGRERWSDLDLMVVGGHECVHAIFHQAGLSRYGQGLDAELLEETTATVLGAHIAGRVAARKGRCGECITRQVVAGFRAECSPTELAPQGWLARQVWRGRLSRIGHDKVHVILNHFGSPALVDEIERLCEQHPDPWDAAHAVARRFGFDSPLGPRVPKEFGRGAGWKGRRRRDPGMFIVERDDGNGPVGP